MADDIRFKEWEGCQKVISEYNERVHDIRKHGFSFITALIAAEAILISEADLVAANKIAISDEVKIAVFSVTLLLIVIVRLMERSYKLFIKCSAQRAQILERSLNLELTEIISDRYRRRHIQGLITSIYIGFVLSVGFLGYSILVPNYWGIYGLALVMLVVSNIIIGAQLSGLNYKRQPIDWTIDPMECESGDIIRITATNVEEDDELPSVELGYGIRWIIEDVDGNIIKMELSENYLVLASEERRVWEWKTNIKEGVYNLIITYNETDTCFKRFIRCLKSLEPKTQKEKIGIKKEKIRKRIKEEYQINKILKYLDQKEIEQLEKRLVSLDKKFKEQMENTIQQKKEELKIYIQKEIEIKQLEDDLNNVKQKDKKGKEIELRKLEDNLNDLITKYGEHLEKINKLKQERHLYMLRRRIIVRKKESKKEETLNLRLFY